MYAQHKRVDSENCSRVTDGHPPGNWSLPSGLPESAKKKNFNSQCRVWPPGTRTISPSSQTRGLPYKLYKPRCTNSTRRNVFAARVIDVWNYLPHTVSFEF